MPAFEPSPGVTHGQLVIQPHVSFLGFPSFEIVSLEVNLLSDGEREVMRCVLWEGREKGSSLETRIGV